MLKRCRFCYHPTKVTRVFQKGTKLTEKQGINLRGIRNQTKMVWQPVIPQRKHPSCYQEVIFKELEICLNAHLYLS